MVSLHTNPHHPGADPGGGGRWVRRPPLGRRDLRRRRGFLRLKGRNKGHWCPLNGCSTPFKHNMATNILKSCKSVLTYVKNRSSPSHIRSSIPWRPPLAEILDPRLPSVGTISSRLALARSLTTTEMTCCDKK